jgi:hypothetical protein
VGGDRYGIEVPARVVTDGFAYYVEAWDNAENGPARSGAPELPHAVIIEEPAPAAVAAGVDVATPRPGSAVEAAFHTGATAAGSPLPPALSPGAPVPAAFARPRSDTPWTLTALLGGERSSEQSYTDSIVLGRIGLEASRWYAGNWLFSGSADWRSYRQQYIPFNAVPRTRVTTDENRFDLAATAGYDLGSFLVSGGSLELLPLLGAQYIGASNTGFGFDMLGPVAGLRASWTFSRFTVRALGTYTYNLTQDSGPNAFLSPLGSLNGRAGLQVRLTPAYAVELDYVGDGIRFEHVWRIAHGAVFGFSTTF